MNSLRSRITVLVVPGVLALVAAGCGNGAQAPTPTPLPAVEASQAALAEARVVPAAHAALSFRTAGNVAQVLVAEGAEVKKGQALVRLESGAEAAAVLAAEAALAAAQADLDQLTAGASPAELAGAQAAVDRARASAAKVASGPVAEDLAIGERQVEEAKNALWGLQAERDALCGRANADCDADDVAASAACKAAREDSQAGCDGAQAAVQAAEERVRIAQLQLDRLRRGADPDDRRAAQAAVREAEAQADQVRAGTRVEALAAARARVDQASAALEQARLQMDATVLRAPLAGTVAMLDARVGEQVLPGVPVAQVADLAHLEVQTDDLTEVNVVGLEPGDPATITFDAIPDLTLDGKVARIRALGENRQGDIVYTVVIEPDQQDPRLRWNMTASVAIENE
jgi:HlyD family secretion protein